MSCLRHQDHDTIDSSLHWIISLTFLFVFVKWSVLPRSNLSADYVIVSQKGSNVYKALRPRTRTAKVNFGRNVYDCLRRRPQVEVSLKKIEYEMGPYGEPAI